MVIVWWALVMVLVPLVILFRLCFCRFIFSTKIYWFLHQNWQQLAVKVETKIDFTFLFLFFYVNYLNFPLFWLPITPNIETALHFKLPPPPPLLTAKMVVIEPLDDECREDSVTTGPAGRSKRNSSLTESQDDANGNRKSSDKKTPQVVDDEDDLQITSCGIGSWRPEWMQVLANTKLFLINICLIGVVQSMAGSVQFTVMNTLEKRFAFDSKISGS